MIYFFNFITHTKSSKIVLLGEPDIPSHLAFSRRAFLFYKIIFIIKKDF
jgi:hypothetical protein